MEGKCYLELSSTNSTLTRNRRNWVLELFCSVLPLANDGNRLSLVRFDCSRPGKSLASQRHCHWGDNQHLTLLCSQTPVTKASNSQRTRQLWTVHFDIAGVHHDQFFTSFYYFRLHKRPLTLVTTTAKPTGKNENATQTQVYVESWAMWRHRPR